MSWKWSWLCCACLILGCAEEGSGSGDESGDPSASPRIFSPLGGGAGAGAGGVGGVPGEPVDTTETGDVAVGDTQTGDVTTAEDAGDGEATQDVVTDVASGPVVNYCDDKVPCTIETVLQDNGGCAGGKFICGDCAGSGCNFDSDCAPFNDDNPCNGTLYCYSGHCKVDDTTIIKCDGQESEDPNFRIRCNPSNGQCEAEPFPDGAECDDGNPCTLYDVMFGGQCAGTDVCADCEGVADGTVCEDNNPCTEQTECTGGRCIGPNTCECTYSKDCTGLEDGNACNGRMACIAGACVVNPDTVIHCQRACPEEGFEGSCYQGDCLEATGSCIGKPVECD